ncbi:hypothetical protein GQ44DRAFT_734365 [Phaeosphaeriaceae sp. PMI808]|nr:hypothetical protein GQ44DRAFT_734365 [Phaeosphaeriaceae sp. PMI808]
MSTILLHCLGRLLLLCFFLSISANFCACFIAFFVIGLPSASSVGAAALSLVSSFYPTFFVGFGLAFHSGFLMSPVVRVPARYSFASRVSFSSSSLEEHSGIARTNLQHRTRNRPLIKDQAQS